LLQRYAQVADFDAETRDSLALRAKQLGIDVDPHESKGKIADEIFKKVARPYLVNPTFVTNHPVDISPLAKRNTKNSEEVRRFQLVIGGFELVNAFSELNDPIDQRARFEDQVERKTGGEAETHEMDTDFVEALEYGMPPAAGAAISIDRLTMLLTDTQNIREVLLFPTMRPK
jgi:lysyl-tRNA synthetase, class II